MVWGKEVFFDGTKVRANADIDSLGPRWYQHAKTHLDSLFAQNGDEGASLPPAAPATDADEAVIRLPSAADADGHARLTE